MRTTRILGEQVYISLYRDVTNASDLRKSLVAAAIAIGDEGNAARERVNFAFINASMVRIPSNAFHKLLSSLRTFRFVVPFILTLLYNKRY